MKITKWISLLLPIAIIIGVWGFCDSTEKLKKGYSPGNIGSLTCVDNNIRAKYIRKYLDTFYMIYPQYNVPDTIKQNYYYQSLDYEHLSLSKFYFSKDTVEVYYIQWSGPGCVNIRFTYDSKTEEIHGNFRRKPANQLEDKEIQRIKSRFECEIMQKLEKIILKYEPQDSIYLKS